MRHIPEMKFEVVAPCQYHCVFCAHDGMMQDYKGYQLSMPELDRFIECTQASDYFIDALSVHGMGEPFLWKHFDEGLQRLKQSGVVGSLSVTTNGLLLDRIADETWTCIDHLTVSVYPGYPKQDLLDRLRAAHGDKIHVIPPEVLFTALPYKEFRGKTPCYCACAGPMFAKDKIYFYCGPPVFDAAKLAGVDIHQRRDLYTDLKPHYLDQADPTRCGNLDLCNSCWANDSIKRPRFEHGYTPSRTELILKTWQAGARHQLRQGAKLLLEEVGLRTAAGAKQQD